MPIAIIVLKRPPEVVPPPAASAQAARPTVLGWPPNVVFAMLAIAAFCCCMPMSMPQVHLVALCSDLGIKPTHGAVMLSVLLGTAFVSRQVWGAISDRIGGLLTMLDRLGLAILHDCGDCGDAGRDRPVHRDRAVRPRLLRDHSGLRAVPARTVSGARGRLARADPALPQRLRHGVGRLGRGHALRSLRLLCAGLRGRARSSIS